LDLVFLCREHEEYVNHTDHGLTRKWNKVKDHYFTFPEWFEDHIRNMSVSDEVKWLSRRPNIVARKFSSYVINGYKFLIEDCERQTQNTGVMVTLSTIRFRSKKDQNPEVEDVNYYGVLKDILELDYYEHSSLCYSNVIGFKAKMMALVSH
jgi:hypothetical protein